MATQIQRLHLSFVFTQPMLQAQDQNASDAGPGPLKRFLTEPGYIDTVNDLVRGTPAPLDLTFPWSHTKGQNFWDRYMGGLPLADTRGRACFEKLVPLKLRRLFHKVLFSGTEDVSVIADGFYFPFGTGMLVRALIDGQYSLEEAAAMALRLRREKAFTVSQEKDSAPDIVNLSQLADLGLNRLKQLAFANAFTGPRSTLFSVATVVAATDADPKPVSDGSLTHRFLACLANGTKNWETVPPPPLEPGKTVLKARKEGHSDTDLILAGDRGTAVWLPSNFVSVSGAPVHTLGCYHRNLSFATLMTESMLGLSSEVQRLLSAPPTPASVQRIGELAGVQLATLYGRKSRSSYASDSVRSQIACSENLQDLNAMRKRLVPSGAPIS